MSKSKKLFILLSLAIALIDILFVTTNYFYTRNTLDKTLQDKSHNDYAIYQTVLASTYNGLSIQAFLFAGDSRIQELFLQGKETLKLEGGDSGGSKTALVRNQLYKLVAQSWHNATKKFDVRHLHFHLGPGALSYLRVHQPDKFGDHLDDLRFLIVDTNIQQLPHSGFETGRVSSGLRSAVPVFAWDKKLQKKTYVGALEVGTSYKKLLETIEHNININISVLLNKQHIKDTVWDEFITGQYNNNTINGCDCVLEASSHPNQKAFLEYIARNTDFSEQLINADGKVKTIIYNNHSYAFTSHSFRDYLGNKISSRKDVGSIIITKNIDDLISLYNKKQWFNILYGVIAYIIVEFLLVLTFINVTKHLTSQVKIQTKELSEQKHIIEHDKLKYKNLADAINDSYFFYTRDRNNKFSFVSPSITQVLGFSQKDFLSNIMQYLAKNTSSDFLSYTHTSFVDNLRKKFELEIYNKSGRLQHLLVTETENYNENNQMVQIEGFAQDISINRRDKMLLKLRCQILQQISEKQSHDKVLNELALGIEAIIKDIHCAIMLFNQQNNDLKIGAAPSLPSDFINILKNIDLNNPKNTACSIAIKTSKRKIIPDLQLFSGGNSASELLEQTVYKASCSEPVLSSNAKVIATIDLYYNKTGKPNESDLLILASATDLITTLLKK